MKKIILFAFIAVLLPHIAITDTDSQTAENSKKAAVEKKQQTLPSQDPQTEGSNETSKNRLNSLFKALKEKSKDIKPTKYEITLPVSTAGARGAETRQADRFSVIWPDTGISPITALTENIKNGVEQGEKKASLQAQLENFKKVFPEFRDHPFLHELADIIEKNI